MEAITIRGLTGYVRLSWSSSVCTVQLEKRSEISIGYLARFHCDSTRQVISQMFQQSGHTVGVAGSLVLPDETHKWSRRKGRSTVLRKNGSSIIPAKDETVIDESSDTPIGSEIPIFMHKSLLQLTPEEVKGSPPKTVCS
jgi:NADH pyrophosphatase NudC (nudix superfamily)